MAKSIVWRTETRKFEFRVISEGRIIMAISERDNESLMETSVNLSVSDAKGIEDILGDLRFDAERELEKGKEVSNG